MNKKVVLGMFAALAVTSAVIYGISKSNSQQTSAMSDVTLDRVEALADESGSDHGRPLLQNTRTGAYKCSNCTGTDCGAAC